MPFPVQFRGHSQSSSSKNKKCKCKFAKVLIFVWIEIVFFSKNKLAVLAGEANVITKTRQSNSQGDNLNRDIVVNLAVIILCVCVCVWRGCYPYQQKTQRMIINPNKTLDHTHPPTYTRTHTNKYHAQNTQTTQTTQINTQHPPLLSYLPLFSNFWRSIAQHGDRMALSR